MVVAAGSYYVYVILAVLLLAVLIPSLVYALRQTVALTRPGAWRVLVPYLSFTILYLVFNLLEIFASTPDRARLFASLCYISSGTVPTWWFLFCLHFSGYSALARRLAPVLWIIPVLAIAIVFTNPFHHWHWEALSYTRVGPFMRMAVESYGAWFWFLASWTALLVISGTSIIAISIARRSLAIHRQVLIVAAGTLVPVLFNGIYLLRLIPGWDKDYTPIGYGVAGVLFTLGVFYNRLFDIVPLARRALVEALPDAVFAVEGGNRLLEMNTKAKELFALEDAFPGSPLPKDGPLAAVLEAFGERDAVEFGADESGWYEGRCTTISAGGRVLQLYSFRDITERRRLLQDKTRLVTRLSEALAELKTLRGIVPICSSCKKIRDDSGYWQQVDEYLSTHSDLEFTHGICPDCRERLYGDGDSAAH